MTLNLGLRWEYFSPVSEVNNRISNIDLATGTVVFPGVNGIGNTAGVKKDFNNFAPRFGFAYTVNPTTRGGQIVIGRTGRTQVAWNGSSAVAANGPLNQEAGQRERPCSTVA